LLAGVEGGNAVQGATAAIATAAVATAAIATAAIATAAVAKRCTVGTNHGPVGQQHSAVGQHHYAPIEVARLHTWPSDADPYQALLVALTGEAAAAAVVGVRAQIHALSATSRQAGNAFSSDNAAFTAAERDAQR
jgi:hypothetical protein